MILLKLCVQISYSLELFHDFPKSVYLYILFFSAIPWFFQSCMFRNPTIFLPTKTTVHNYFPWIPPSWCMSGMPMRRVSYRRQVTDSGMGQGTTCVQHSGRKPDTSSWLPMRILSTFLSFCVTKLPVRRLHHTVIKMLHLRYVVLFFLANLPLGYVAVIWNM